MSGQRKRSKSASSVSRTLYFDKNDAKDMIEKKYGIFRSFDDVYDEEHIELDSLNKSKKSKKFLSKLIFNFDKKNKNKSSYDKNANNEFVRQTFVKTAIPRVSSYYHNSLDEPIQPWSLTYDEIDKILLNEKTNSPRRHKNIFEKEFEDIDDLNSTVEPTYTIVKSNYENNKINWNNTMDEWNETTIDKKANKKGTIKRMLINLMRLNKNKHNYQENQISDKYETNQQIYNIPVIPRVMEMVSHDHNKNNNNIDMNRSATIRPIYGIKRNQSTPIKSLKTFQPEEITLPCTKISNCNNGKLSNEEYSENLIKPSAIKKLAKQLILNSPIDQHQSLSLNQNQPKSPIPYKNQYISSTETYEYQLHNKSFNKNQDRSENSALKQSEHPIKSEADKQLRDQQYHVDLCKIVLKQCREQNKPRHYRLVYDELKEIETKSNKNDGLFING